MRKNKPKGTIVLTMKNEKTGEEKVLRMDNVLVTNFRQIEARLLAGDDLVNHAIDSLEFGTGGAAEVAADNSLTSTAPATDVAVTATYPTSSSVTFSGTLSTAEGNGFTFAEMGLRFGDNTLATRKAFTGMAKTVLWSWSVEWTISWV